MSGEPLLPFESVEPRKRRPSLTDKLDAYLRPRRGSWVSVGTMAALVGTSGVRQRRLEVEKRWGWKFKGEYREGAYGFLIVNESAPQQTGRAA